MAKLGRRRSFGFGVGAEWTIIDLVTFLRLCGMRRMEGLLSNHDGQCLRFLEERVTVGRAFGAVSASQARLFAANGGSATSLALVRRKRGDIFSDFSDHRRYVAIENAVMQKLRELAEIPWHNLNEVRRQLHQEYGGVILGSLCQTFPPNAERCAETKRSRCEPAKHSEPIKPIPWYAQREPGSDRAERGPFLLPGLYDPLEFPLPEVRYEPFAAFVPARPSRRRRVKRMVQLIIEWPPPPLYDRRAPHQAMLFLV